ncbi:hypothetical protein BgiBS90_032310, partial [Biomphalaria glabrata]
LWQLCYQLASVLSASYFSYNFVKKSLYSCGPIRLHVGWKSLSVIECARESQH